MASAWLASTRAVLTTLASPAVEHGACTPHRRFPAVYFSSSQLQDLKLHSVTAPLHSYISKHFTVRNSSCCNSVVAISRYFRHFGCFHLGRVFFPACIWSLFGTKSDQIPAMPQFNGVLVSTRIE